MNNLALRRAMDKKAESRQLFRDAVLERARARYPELEIADNAIVSASERGAWVTAWAWIDWDEVENWQEDVDNPVTVHELADALKVLLEGLSVRNDRFYRKPPAHVKQALTALARYQGKNDPTAYLSA